MRPSYHPRLINGPFDDPGLFIPFQHLQRAILFDLGSLHALSPRDLLKVTHVFISHTHMDHFIGFDHLLRLFLGREKGLHLFGPRGILKNVVGKLSGYTWNLVDRYPCQFSLTVTEVDTESMRTQRFECRNRFEPDAPLTLTPFYGTLLLEPAFSVTAAVLDHKIDCLGFGLTEKFHINILKTGLDRLALPVGPWLKELKEKIYAGVSPDERMTIRAGNNPTFLLSDLVNQVTRITPGQKIAYITDVVGSASNIEKIAALAAGSDHLFIEAHFLQEDNEIAVNTYHLTAAQAGRIARKARVGQCTPFHFSPRYSDEAERVIAEVADAAGPEIIVHKWPSAGDEA